MTRLSNPFLDRGDSHQQRQERQSEDVAPDVRAPPSDLSHPFDTTANPGSSTLVLLDELPYGGEGASQQACSSQYPSSSSPCIRFSPRAIDAQAPRSTTSPQVPHIAAHPHQGSIEERHVSTPPRIRSTGHTARDLRRASVRLQLHRVLSIVRSQDIGSDDGDDEPVSHVLRLKQDGGLPVYRSLKVGQLRACPRGRTRHLLSNRLL